MGAEIEGDDFREADRIAFREKIERSVDVLRSVLARPGFGEGPASIGAELEVDLVDAAGRPALLNREVLADTVDQRFTLEIDRFNLEINARPTLLAGRPFERLASQLMAALAGLSEAAKLHDVEVATVGILPTLVEGDLDLSVLTDHHRYRALAHQLGRSRGWAPASLRIDGRERLDVSAHEITFEGAATSFQVHLRVAPRDFVRSYNAAQLATGFVVAVSGNSPFFLGRRLWDETRVALFRQSADDRAHPQADDFRPARVSFGHGWARTSIVELFEEAVALHEPLLPRCGEEDPEEVEQAGGVPLLSELRLHQGTVWRWNRAIFDPTGEGHVRIEMRALPSGPTVADMVANAALAIGLTSALAADADRLVSRITFGHARRNFYEAAVRGLDAQLLWPSSRGASPRLCSIAQLAETLLPLARRGLVEAGVEEDEAARWLDIVRGRIEAGVTGAVWQSRAVAELERTMPRDESIAGMFARYRELAATGAPVHSWPP